MTRVEDERAAFRAAPDREAYLRANSRLPGPRANLELLAAAAEEVEPEWARRWADQTPDTDPTDVFLICVGLVALGRLLGGGDERVVPLLRRRANAPEWRIREAVAIALQRSGDERPDRLAEIALAWADAGTPLEARAAVAAVAEPRLLRDGRLIPSAVSVLETATQQVASAPKRRDDAVRVLRQALGYAWSVVIAADPARTWDAFQRWAAVEDPDIRWIVAENLKKNRLRKVARAS
jgi:hypothetical protein